MTRYWKMFAGFFGTFVASMLVQIGMTDAELAAAAMRALLESFGVAGVVAASPANKG